MTGLTAFAVGIGLEVLLDDSDGLFHWTCCDDDIALCGKDVSRVPWGPLEGEQVCVVCADLEPRDVPCNPNCVYAERAR